MTGEALFLARIPPAVATRNSAFKQLLRIELSLPPSLASQNPDRRDQCTMRAVQYIRSWVSRPNIANIIRFAENMGAPY